MTPDPFDRDIDLEDLIKDRGFPGERFDLICADCGAQLQLRRTRQARMTPFYGCSRYPACQSAHGAHRDGRPKGVPGNKETRKARIRAHTVFDQLWKLDSPLGKARLTRGQAYAWMRTQLGLTRAAAHIGNFDVAQCERLIQEVFAAYPRLQTRSSRLRYMDPFDNVD